MTTLNFCFSKFWPFSTVHKRICEILHTFKSLNSFVMPLGTIRDYYKKITMTTLNFAFPSFDLLPLSTSISANFCILSKAWTVLFCLPAKSITVFASSPVMCSPMPCGGLGSERRNVWKLRDFGALFYVVTTTTNISFSWQDLSIMLDLLVEAAVRLSIS